MGLPREETRSRPRRLAGVYEVSRKFCVKDERGNVFRQEISGENIVRGLLFYGTFLFFKRPISSQALSIVVPFCSFLFHFAGSV